MAHYNIEEERKASINYFGLGLSKTGLTSLTQAFGMLGYRAIQGPSHKIRKMAHTFDFLCAPPISTGYFLYDNRHPRSKFIFTDRDIDCWLRSAETFWKDVLSKPRTKRLYYRHMQEFGIYHFDKDIFRRTFELHKLRVMEYFKNRPDDLLVMRICDGDGDGWETLCAFLGEPVPDLEFPWRRKQYAVESE